MATMQGLSGKPVLILDMNGGSKVMFHNTGIFNMAE